MKTFHHKARNDLLSLTILICMPCYLVIRYNSISMIEKQLIGQVNPRDGSGWRFPLTWPLILLLYPIVSTTRFFFIILAPTEQRLKYKIMHAMLIFIYIYILQNSEFTPAWTCNEAPLFRCCFLFR